MTWRPKRGFRVGAMRERITIQSADVDSSTGQPVRTWSATFSDVPASLEPATGTETVRGRQVEANTKAVFIIRTLAVDPEMRIIHGSDTYGITAVKSVEGGPRYLELHCRGVA